jgi:hypothetical protein
VILVKVASVETVLVEAVLLKVAPVETVLVEAVLVKVDPQKMVLEEVVPVYIEVVVGLNKVLVLVSIETLYMGDLVIFVNMFSVWVLLAHVVLLAREVFVEAFLVC